MPHHIPHLLPAAACAAALLCAAAAAQQPGTAPFDRSALLRELETLERSHREKVTAEQKTIGLALGKALSNTRELLDLYAEAVFATRFEGAKKGNAEFRKWKNGQDDLFKDDDFHAALTIHANHLYLTFLRATGEEPRKVNEALLQHVGRVWAAEAKHDLRKRAFADLLDRPVTQGVLARHLQFASKLPALDEQDKGWELLAAHTDGMLEKTLLPYLRTLRTPLLIQLWDKRIECETARARRSGLQDRLGQFTRQTLPRLQWRRARDLILLGRDAEGFTLMIGLLRQNANPADFALFAKDLRELLTAAPSAPGTPE
ncbi:MAG: hypothetical protein RBT78_10875 [Kiritimatiellia bacterium]|nr:hypothetical protein [Kiritimatiellia bacterium]